MFLFALCIQMSKDQSLSTLQSIICYAIMVIPHVLMHFTYRLLI
ncbi:hypothetical protein FYJ33_11910 [Clostridiaceae bacterium WCA-383-APC-5B]|uniref:Uncharacterized protein n=1 Tax=Inconstantimicrobium porci TaxID=2652291 RepID=A0A7X2MZP7_9CLOT|nr:hypothetical protein [Inconstantimicrobium porci]